MKKIILTAISIFLLQFSAYAQDEQVKLNDLKSQIFNLDTINHKLVKGINGTLIDFNREDYLIRENQKITLELKEYSKSFHAIFIQLTVNGQKVRLKENKRIPIKVPEKSFVYNKLYYSKTEVNDKFEWVSQPIYYGVISFDSEWQIDVLKSVSKDSLDYYNYTDADGNEHSSKVSDFMIDKQGWFKMEK